MSTQDVQAEPILDVRELVKRYPNGQLALGGVTVQVWPGELVAVLGANGSGKSTLLRCAVRLIDPTSGSVRLGGADLAQLGGRRLRDARRRVGLVLQSPSLVRRRTVMDNVATGALGRHRDLPSHLGRAPRSELRLAGRPLPGRGGIAGAGPPAGRHPVRRPGPTGRGGQGAVPAAGGSARR